MTDPHESKKGISPKERLAAENKFVEAFQSLVLDAIDSAGYTAELAGRDVDATQMGKLFSLLESYFEQPRMETNISRRTVVAEDGIKYPDLEHPGTYLHTKLQLSEGMKKTAQAVALDMNVWGGYGLEKGSLHHHQGTSLLSDHMTRISDDVVSQPTRVSVAVKVTDLAGRTEHVVNFKFQVNKHNGKIVIGSAMLGPASKPDWFLQPSLVIEGHLGQTFDPKDTSLETRNKRTNQQNYSSLRESLQSVQKLAVQLTPRE